jgi:hypothetical protein
MVPVDRDVVGLRVYQSALICSEHIHYFSQIATHVIAKAC